MRKRIWQKDFLRRQRTPPKKIYVLPGRIASDSSATNIEKTESGAAATDAKQAVFEMGLAGN